MKGFGVHTSMWTMAWDRPGAERAVTACKALGFDFIEIALLSPEKVDTAHSRALLEREAIPAVCSLGLPEGKRASSDPEAAIAFLALYAYGLWWWTRRERALLDLGLFRNANFAIGCVLIFAAVVLAQLPVEEWRKCRAGNRK